MQDILHLGGLVCGGIGCLAITHWTFRRVEISLRVARAGTAASLVLFAVAIVLRRLG